MGGTSTDVSLVVDGEVERVFETTIAGIHLRSPALRVHSVAAGGGSLCRFDGFRLTGRARERRRRSRTPLLWPAPKQSPPDGRGAHADRRERSARPPARGPLPAGALALSPHARHSRRWPRPYAQRVMLSPPIRSAKGSSDRQCEHGRAIRQVSVARGVDPRDCALVGFGGAAGQHVCAVARALGIRTILLHPLASLLSAFGIGMAPQTWIDSATRAAFYCPRRRSRCRRPCSRCLASWRRRAGAPSWRRVCRKMRCVSCDASTSAMQGRRAPSRSPRPQKTRTGPAPSNGSTEHALATPEEGRAIEIVVARVQALQANGAIGLDIQSMAAKGAPPRPADSLRGGALLWCGSPRDPVVRPGGARAGRPAQGPRFGGRRHLHGCDRSRL